MSGAAVTSSHPSNTQTAILQVEHLDPLVNQLCRVCDEPAAGFHFGAFTCEGCKSFFGRTCNNQSVIAECKNSYRCVVDKKNRTSCKACRLRKCLMVGMSKSGSRYGRRSNWFKIHCLMQQKPAAPNCQDTPPAPPPLGHPWTSPAPALKQEEGGDHRDSSFGSSMSSSCVSRSPSPNTSLESLSKKSSLPSPRPVAESPGLAPASPPLSSLLPGHLPFYKLSPLLAAAAHNPLLANPFLLQLAGHQHQQQQQQQVPRSHLQLLAEHRDLLAKFGAARSAALAAAAAARPPSPVASAAAPCAGDGPMDLSVKLSVVAAAAPASPSSSAPDDEGIEVDIGDKSDSSLRAEDASLATPAPGSVLDLTVSS